jgi:hypothetical protein
MFILEFFFSSIKHNQTDFSFELVKMVKKNSFSKQRTLPDLHKIFASKYKKNGLTIFVHSTTHKN